MRWWAWIGSALIAAAAVLWGRASAGSEGGEERRLSCPLPHPESAVAWSAPEGSWPPPIDQRAPAHLRVATFALG